MADDALFSRFGRTFVAGTVLFREGEPGDQMYVVQSGRVALTRRVREGEHMLATLGPGDFFGEMALLSSRPRSATATVIEEARCLVLGTETLEAMIRSNAEIAVRMIKKLGERLEAADGQIEALLDRDAPSRVVRRLIALAQTQAEPVEGGLLVRFHRNEFAAAVAVPVAELDSLFAKLERARFVAAHADGVVVPDVGDLADYLDYCEKRARYSAV